MNIQNDDDCKPRTKKKKKRLKGSRLVGTNSESGLGTLSSPFSLAGQQASSSSFDFVEFCFYYKE